MFKYYGGSTENDVWSGFYSDDNGDLTIHTDEYGEIIFFHLNFMKDNVSYGLIWKLKGSTQFVLNNNGTEDSESSSRLQNFPSEYVIDYLDSQAGDIDADHRTFIVDMLALNDKIRLKIPGESLFQRLLNKLPYGSLICDALEKLKN